LTSLSITSLFSTSFISTWVILLILVHTGNLQLLAIFHNLAANEHGFLLKTSKISITTPKQSRLFLILLNFTCFFPNYSVIFD